MDQFAALETMHLWILGEGLAGAAEGGHRRAAEAEEAGGQQPPGGQRARQHQR